MNRYSFPIKALALPIFLIAFAIFGCSSPDEVDISVRAPTTVPLGRRFEFHAIVQNTSSTEKILVDLDVAEEYLEGIVVEGTQPQFLEAYHLPIDNTMSYSFDIPIEPGGQTLVVFSAYAAKTGDFSGEIDFCINSEIACLSYPIRTIID